MTKQSKNDKNSQNTLNHLLNYTKRVVKQIVKKILHVSLKRDFVKVAAAYYNQKLPFSLYLNSTQPVNVIIRSLLSLIFWPNVIQIKGGHCVISLGFCRNAVYLKDYCKNAKMKVIYPVRCFIFKYSSVTRKRELMLKTKMSIKIK